MTANRAANRQRFNSNVVVALALSNPC